MNIIPAVYIILLNLSFLHPLHVTVTEIEMDVKDKALEVTMRVFIEDITSALQKNLNQPALDVLKPGTKTTDQLLQNYLSDRFIISLDNKIQKINYIGHEVEDDAFIVYLEVAKVKKWKTIQVKNIVLMETYEDQSNLVNVTVQGTVRSMRLTTHATNDKINFDFK